MNKANLFGFEDMVTDYFVSLNHIRLDTKYGMTDMFKLFLDKAKKLIDTLEVHKNSSDKKGKIYKYKTPVTIVSIIDKDISNELHSVTNEVELPKESLTYEMFEVNKVDVTNIDAIIVSKDVMFRCLNGKIKRIDNV
jgi:hypothetical protein